MATKIALTPQTGLVTIATTIDTAEAAVRAAVPHRPGRLSGSRIWIVRQPLAAQG